MARRSRNHNHRQRSRLRICPAGAAPDYPWAPVVALLLPLGVAVWSHWATIESLSEIWRTNDDYSAGQLVPFVILFLVWCGRKSLKRLDVRPCWLGGFALVLMAETLRFYGLLSLRFTAERYAVVPLIGGLILLLAGRQVFRRVSWILLFLFLMFPLPGRVHSAVSDPLQRIATSGAVFMLEAFGVRVTQQGNIVNLGDSVPMAVAEACSGLRMLTAFIIVTAFIAYMVKRPRWHKGILLASSIPLALACNIIRIFLTGVIMVHVSVELGATFFHDYAGLVMMPAAVLIVFWEIWLLDRIIQPDEKATQERHVIVRAAGRRQRWTKAL